MQYSLTIDIDSAGLKSIYAATQYITIVKSVLSNPEVASELPIAWLAFQPLESNQLTWVENYAIYASTTTLQSGVTIAMTSQEPAAQLGWTYTFEQGQFTPTQGSGDTFNVSDQMAGLFNFGLAQSAIVNNVATFAPLNSVPVLFNENASFTPQETVSIFLSSYANNGTVISEVAGNALTVLLTSQSPSADISFNDDTNTFYQMSNSASFAKRLSAIRRAA